MMVCVFEDRDESIENVSMRSYTFRADNDPKDGLVYHNCPKSYNLWRLDEF
jgi:hypothetical protein